jgi:non-canonical poly(A) RNA polymerase PAPD5/7
MKEFEKIIKNNKSSPISIIRVLMDAKVPLFKCVHQTSKIKLDIIFNEVTGISQISDYLKANNIFPELKYLYIFFKFFLRQRDLNDTYSGGVGKFYQFSELIFTRKLSLVRNDNHISERLSKEIEKPIYLIFGSALITISPWLFTLLGFPFRF